MEHLKPPEAHVATLLHVLGKECVEVYSHFVWDDAGDRHKIAKVEEKFKAYCEPLTSKNFNRHLFIERKQKEGETADEYCSALKTLAKNCDLGDKEESWVTPMLVLGLKGLRLKEETLQGGNITKRKPYKLPHRGNQQAAHEKLEK